MWLLLSTRLRTWLAVAIAVPLIQRLIHRAAVTSGRRNPEAGATRLLQRTDTILTALAGRLGRRYRRAK